MMSSESEEKAVEDDKDSSLSVVGKELHPKIDNHHCSSDSEDEFYDATEEVGSLRRSPKEGKAKKPSKSKYQLEMEKLEEAKRQAEERRIQEFNKFEEKRKELERLKQEEEELELKRQLEEEERKRKEEEEEAERRRKELEEEEKYLKEQEKLKIERKAMELERRRKRLEKMRREEETEGIVSQGLEAGENKMAMPEAFHDAHSNSLMPPEVNNEHPEPILVSSTRPTELALNSAPYPQEMEAAAQPPPLPVAPPRKRKKKKTAEAEGEVKEDKKEDGGPDQGTTKGLPLLPVEETNKRHSALLTPTATVESLTKELEHSLDLASATHGESVVQHQDTESVRGGGNDDGFPEHESVYSLESLEKESSKLDYEESSVGGGSDGGGTGPGVAGGDATAAAPPVAENAAGSNDEEEQRLIMKGQTKSGKQLTDEEVLSHVFVTNLDTGEKIPLSLAEERLPKCINPLSLHIMRITSEYVSNTSLNKNLNSDVEGENKGAAEDSHQKMLRKKTKKIKRFLGKTMEKTVSKLKSVADEVFMHEDNDSSSDDDFPDARTIKMKASSSNKGPYEFDRLRMVQNLSGEHAGAVWTMKFSHCGRLLATAGQDKILRIWVLKDHFSYFDDMRQKYNSEGRTSPSPSQESLNSQASEKSGLDPERAAAQDPEAAQQPQQPHPQGMQDAQDQDEMRTAVFAPRSFCTYEGHNGDVLDVSWSKNYFILSSSMDKTVRLWHISRRECLCCFQHIDFVTAIAFHPRDDRYFLSGSLDGKLRLWNIPDKKVALWNEVGGNTKLITAANFCQNGKFAVAGTYDGRCVFFDTEHLKYFTQIHVRSTRGRNAKGRKVSGIEPLPGQDKILVTSNDSRVRLYDLRDLSLSCKYKGASNNSSQIKANFSHNSKYIVCGSEDQYVYIWRTNHDFMKFTSARRDRNDYWEAIKAHNAVVTAAIFAPNPFIMLADKEEEMDGGGEEAAQAEGATKKSERLERGDILVTADFQGVIKVFVNPPKA